MKNEEQIIVRKLKETQMERGSCGMRRRLITDKDCDTVAFSHLKISDAKKHYHEKTTEFYYVLKGEGLLEVDGESISLTEGTLVMIRPGMAHRAVSSGGLEVLIAMTPPLAEAGDYVSSKGG
ncbi:MAG: cupin domain-containing protein [Candidatus Methanoperedens sp.]|nr:cupin domain-containing protein [Candidatus Methanoperedens nitroreducens]MDJ1423598.1 cupin domain-containing protein [Candidatus Methanoperedens sp.]